MNIFNTTVGKLLRKLPLLIVFLFMLHSETKAQFPPNDPSWELKFSDDFDSIYSSNIIDNTKWDRSFPWGQSGGLEICGCPTTCDTLTGKSYFVQWNDTAAHSIQVDTVGSGILKIIARKQNYYGHTTDYFLCGSPLCNTPCFWDDNSHDSICSRNDSVLFNYTTAMLYSRYKFKYGYFELKFRIPAIPTTPPGATNKGFTTDWWMFDGDPVTGKSSEIDIFEIDNEITRYTNNVHYIRDFSGTDLAGSAFQRTPLDSTWHISALEWGPDRIDFFLDGAKIRSYPFKPDSLLAMPIIIDMDANATNFCKSIDTINTVFPFEFDVDYIKVYQLKQECDSAISICTYNPLTYDFSIKESLTMGGAGCTTTIPTLSNTSFRASDFIQLDQGFNADNATEMLLDVTPCQDDQYYNHRTVSPPMLPPVGFTRLNHH